ncbi:hypothetical protein ACTTAL_09710 [Rhodobacter capsulatus]|uniref:hypothetical protein n=1 Tax=Rhodobacter capsulatus TaxID=1061 RepID=UPI0003D2D0B7|nr:hypothetical protein [Rhodobacter capsulatus]ETD91993.1 hypothetical protein U713_01415 [Rhodobacter capsulatus YW2]
MKLDIFSWSEEKSDGFQVGKGRVQILLSGPAALYAEAQGYETLVGYAASFDFETSEALTLRVDVSDKARKIRVFRQRPNGTTTRAEGEVFTNIDRMVDESGSFAEVTQALRQFKIEQRRVLRDLQIERRQLQHERAKLRAAPVEPASAQIEPQSEGAQE